MALAAGAAHAQNPDHTGPTHYPLNPMSVSRTGLWMQPYLPQQKGWSYSVAMDYASAVEWEQSHSARYVLDAELMRLQLGFRRDLSPSRFLQIGLDLNGVFNGFADGAFDWYHSTIGISFRGREERPRNQFGYALHLPSGDLVERERPDYFLGDLRLAYGLRHGGSHQTTIAMTLPTSTAPAGYSRQTLSVGAIHTVRKDLSQRFVAEGTLGVGLTPREGALSSYQRTVYNSSSASLQIRLFGRNVLYGSLFTHSALYDDTTLPELEKREWSGDFGWLGRTAAGREWRLGFTEDFGPTDAGIDLILRFGTTW